MERRKTAMCAVLFLLVFVLGRTAAALGRTGADENAAIRMVDPSGDEGGKKAPDESGEYRELPRRIAITFDDGPNPTYTEKLLKGLKKREVKATFFLLGKEVERYPEIVKKIADDGHLIGVHSYEHVNFSQIGDEAAIRQIDRTRDAIETVTGEYPGFIRPPYGCWKDSLNRKVPMIEVLWDIDPLDWATTDADLVTQRILTAVRKRGSIILLHDASDSSVRAALRVIDALTEQGCEFVTVEELILE